MRLAVILPNICCTERGSFWQMSCQEYGTMPMRAAELAARGRPMYRPPVLNGWNWG